TTCRSKSCSASRDGPPHCRPGECRDPVPITATTLDPSLTSFAVEKLLAGMTKKTHLSGDPMSELTPREIVNELDRYIIGQHDAKRAVAVALRSRWRRMQLPAEMRNEITPKNILMIGPTGVGKTEIARRLATLANAPFVKVEATKFTEVGYVGKDVESIIRDLADGAYKLTREQA